MVGPGICLCVQHFFGQWGGVAHTVAVSEVPIIPFSPRTTVAKLRAAGCMWGTASHPMDRVGSEGVGCAATKTLSCTKQATLGGERGNEEKEKEKRSCHLPLSSPPALPHF